MGWIVRARARGGTCWTRNDVKPEGGLEGAWRRGVSCNPHPSRRLLAERLPVDTLVPALPVTRSLLTFRNSKASERHRHLPSLNIENHERLKRKKKSSLVRGGVRNIDVSFLGSEHAKGALVLGC